MLRLGFPLVEKLMKLAERAKELQLQSGTTSPTLNHLPAERKTTRQTISLVLTSGGAAAPTFVFHREPMPQKASEEQPQLPPVHRAAVFGGGIESLEERRLRELAHTDPLLLDLQLLDASGGYPPDAWYRLQGKHMLRHGHLQQMAYPLTTEKIGQFVQEELRRRLQMEAGEATSLIGEPAVLHAAPVETAVLHRRLGPYTEAIAGRYGMSVNERGELVGIGILVQERFTIAQLLCDPRRFAERAEGNALVWTADRLIANAERDTASLEAWRSRLAHQESDESLPIRNHSLLVGASAAALHLRSQSSLIAALKRLWARLWGRHLLIAV